MKQLLSSTKLVRQHSQQLLRAMINSIIVPRMKSKLPRLPFVTTEEQPQPQRITTYQDVLVEQARVSNTAAIQLLTMKKEYGLFQYYGFFDYVRQKITNTTGSSNNHNNNSNEQQIIQPTTTEVTTNNNDNNNDNNNNNDNDEEIGRNEEGNHNNNNGDNNDDKKSNKGSRVVQEKNQPPQKKQQLGSGGVAKIAFMITGSMKLELVQRLGYELEQIKKLTPTEASLLIHHNIMAKDMGQQLPRAVQDHNEQQQQMQVQQQQQLQQKQEEEEKEEEEALKLQVDKKDESNDSSQIQEEDLRTDIAESEDPVLVTSLENSATELGGDTFQENEKQEHQEERKPVLQREEDTQCLEYDGVQGESKKSETSSDSLLWYQLVETNAATSHNSNTSSTGETSVIGLYNNLEEANLAMETKREFAERDQIQNKNINKGQHGSKAAYEIIPKRIQ